MVLRELIVEKCESLLCPPSIKRIPERLCQHQRSGFDIDNVVEPLYETVQYHLFLNGRAE